MSGAVLLALVSGGVGGVAGTYLERNGGVGTVELPQAGKEPAGRDADSVAGIAGRALPSVVTLHVSGAGEQGTGTGFVLDARGHILTNNHVVQSAGSAGEITVTFNSGETAQAEIVGRDSGYDLAVVKVKGVRGLTPLPLGNSDNVRVGDPVVAIGAPFDLAGTVTSGIISAKQRPITAGGEKGDGSDVSYVDALQTDAPINPGNSGGPLLDSRARAIGINSAIRSADSGSEPDGGQSGSIGLGFAIPINQGKRVAEELINTGKATHPVIGITLDMDYTGDGARVATEGSEGGPPVTVGGPGAKAGIKAGDVITDGRRSARSLRRGTDRQDPRPPSRRPAGADRGARWQGAEGLARSGLRRRRLSRDVRDLPGPTRQTIGKALPLTALGGLGTVPVGRDRRVPWIRPGPRQDPHRPPRAEDRGHRKELQVFNDIGPLELVTLIVLAVLVFGPDKLPKVIQDVTRTIRKIREFSESAKHDIREELGPEFKDFEFEDLNPKTFIRKQMDNEDLGLKEIRNGFDLKKEMAEVTDAVHSRDTDPSSSSSSGAAGSSGGRIDMTKKPETPDRGRPPALRRGRHLSDDTRGVRLRRDVTRFILRSGCVRPEPAPVRPTRRARFPAARSGVAMLPSCCADRTSAPEGGRAVPVRLERGGVRAHGDDESEVESRRRRPRRADNRSPPPGVRSTATCVRPSRGTASTRPSRDRAG